MKYGELKRILKYQAKCGICGTSHSMSHVKTYAEAEDAMKSKGWRKAQDKKRHCRLCSARIDEGWHQRQG